MILDLDLHRFKSHIKLKKEGDKVYLWDIIRKRYVVLQPEEMVRQLLIYYLIDYGYAKEKIQVEKGLQVNGLKRRFDIVVYDKDYNPYLLVECKSHKVPLTQDTFDQVARYNIDLKAPYLLATNGVQTYCCALDFEYKTYEYMDKLPSLNI